MQAENQRWTINQATLEANSRDYVDPNLGFESASCDERTTFISSARITGDLFFSGKAVIDSEIQGNIESNSELILEKNSQITGDICGQKVSIQGSVFGKIKASVLLTLKKGAFIKGDISCKRLIIEDGVVFEGFCDMECAPKL